MNDRSGPEVDGVGGLVGADEEIGILVRVKIHSGGQRPAEGANGSVDVARHDYLQSIFLLLLSLFVWKHFRHCLRFQMAKRKSLNVLCVGGQAGIHDHILGKVKLG